MWSFFKNIEVQSIIGNEIDQKPNASYAIENKMPIIKVELPT